MLKVSVIVPVYNTEKYLKRCLDSIINQSLKEIEIIVVNDGSTDNSKNIIKSYEKKDSRIKIVNKPNGGLSSARNEGIKVAKSKYIAHIDSDDWVEYNYLEEMYLKAEKENLDIVISDIYWDYIDKIDYKRDLLISDKVIINSKEYLKLFFQGKILPAVCNKIYKTELYQSYNIFHPENISLGEDLSTSPLLAQNAKRIGKINKAYLHYYQNLESITKSNPTKKIYELISAFNILKNNIKKFDKKDIISLEIVHLS
ncbi:MAG: glycosyltransferase family 2 protein, partial [Cetobacterium sp.]|uniref:glycosyltransferase family 2 protein n=1 Tax=Cetobacterium sp. TaxID=2071632 RepID=UPI003EE7CF75